MRRYDQNWQTGNLQKMWHNVRRRQEWFTEHAGARQLANFLLAGSQFALKREVTAAWPVIVKIDISPLCHLHCTYCVHAEPRGENIQLLSEQEFHGDQKMSLERFEHIVQEIGGKSMAVSLYYLGDPLTHPQLPQMCRAARDAKLNVHISTHFSYKLSDARLEALVTSGLTHLTACVDGLDQEHYARTRVGGQLDRVLDNIQRLLQIRRRLGQVYPKVEVQFIKFQHNLMEVDEATRWCAEQGVDQFTEYWGNLHNYTDLNPENIQVFEPKTPGWLPRCSWPHFSMQIKYNGDVIPCCYYRHGDQYRSGGESRSVGNVFDSNVWEVWNAPAYRALRRFVANPQRALHEAELEKSFCHGCAALYHTDVADHERVADRHSWEELYTQDDHGHVARRSRTPAPG